LCIHQCMDCRVIKHFKGRSIIPQPAHCLSRAFFFASGPSFPRGTVISARLASSLTVASSNPLALQWFLRNHFTASSPICSLEGTDSSSSGRASPAAEPVHGSLGRQALPGRPRCLSAKPRCPSSVLLFYARLNLSALIEPPARFTRTGMVSSASFSTSGSFLRSQSSEFFASILEIMLVQAASRLRRQEQQR
jgi:hypothetical protein